MTDAAPTDEPDAIAHMTDVELETFARAVVAERDALAAALESAREELDDLRETTFPKSWGGFKAFIDEVYPVDLFGVGNTDGPAMVQAAHALADLSAELAAERAKVQELRDPLAELVRLKDGPRDDAYAAAKPLAWDAARAALAAAQPTGKTP